MGLFGKLTDGIIQTVGITAPTPAERRRTAILLGALVLAIVLAFAAGAVALMEHFLG